MFIYCSILVLLDKAHFVVVVRLFCSVVTIGRIVQQMNQHKPIKEDYFLVSLVKLQYQMLKSFVECL